ncbi:HIT domain-containing protein [candidate division KSB1 bacterium]|nr:HIT domain-containing protein [candidate division KSB1 bacterium]
MDRLWAPWRMEYILSTVKQPDASECIFCRMIGERRDAENLILHRGQHALVVMNLFPYNSGHLMVVPLRHTAEFSSLGPAEHLELMELMTLGQRALGRVYGPHGYNIGMNIGRAAGAGIVDHLHYHIVPRWNGDTNFMSAVATTKVMSESLPETWQRLKSSLAELLGTR